MVNFTVNTLKESKQTTGQKDYTQGQLIDKIREANNAGVKQISTVGYPLTDSIVEFFRDGGFKLSKNQITWE